MINKGYSVDKWLIIKSSAVSDLLVHLSEAITLQGNATVKRALKNLKAKIEKQAGIEQLIKAKKPAHNDALVITAQGTAQLQMLMAVYIQLA